MLLKLIAPIAMASALLIPATTTQAAGTWPWHTIGSDSAKGKWKSVWAEGARRATITKQARVELTLHSAGHVSLSWFVQCSGAAQLSGTFGVRNGTRYHSLPLPSGYHLLCVISAQTMVIDGSATLWVQAR